MTKAAVLKATRLTHMYLGIFITPALLFFAFSGFLQTFGLNDRSPDGSYKPPVWIQTLAQIHKKQTANLPPPRKPAPPAVNLDTPGAPPPSAATKPAPNVVTKEMYKTGPMKLFFALVCLGLFTSTVTGLYMSYTFLRNKALVTATLVAGIVIPPLLLFI